MLAIISGPVLDWIGYIASFIVLISLLMTSIKKLRWINLIGSVLFGTYGFLISSIPTGLMNVGIALINIYYLYKMYTNKEYFKLLEVTKDSDYLPSFLDYYEDDIKAFANIRHDIVDDADLRLFVLRDMKPASVFLGKKVNETQLEIELDYAIPMYRDFKLGHFLFKKNKEFFLDKGIHSLIVHSDVDPHITYLKKMGFTLVEGETHTYEFEL
jgi:hypothetical protein